LLLVACEHYGYERNLPASVPLSELMAVVYI
jgi:hypothetical protein